MASSEGIKLRAWVKRGDMQLNTACLEPDDPEHLYNQVARRDDR